MEPVDAPVWTLRLSGNCTSQSSASSAAPVSLRTRHAHANGGDALLRGEGVPTEKSAPFTFTSAQPLWRRLIEVDTEGAAVFVPPSLQLAVEPYPTKSITAAPLGQDPVSVVWFETRASLPVVMDMSVVP